jgi:hypothetical protein
VESLFDQLLSLQIGSALSASDLLVRVLVAWLTGQLIGWLYMGSHESLSYSQSYVQSLVLLTMVVCIITAAVGSSFVRFFVLGTALAIIRFRTPLKEAQDTVFMFLAAGLGMSLGLGLYIIAIPAAILIGGTALHLRWTAFGTRSRQDGVLRLQSETDTASDAIEQVLRRYCRGWELTATAPADGGTRRVYDVSLRDPNDGDALLRELLGVGGVNEASLLNRARAGEA